MKVVTSFNNYARAKIDHDALGRFDLPIYTSGSDLFRNFESNFKGNAMFRRGFETMEEFQDCAFIEFRFSNAQNYIVVAYANKFRFLSYDSNGNFGWVLDGGGPPAILEVATPYTLAEAKYIAMGRPAQNADVMVFTINGHEPRKLVRTSANAFTFNTFARKDDPFVSTFAATVNISAVTQAANALVTTTGAHGLVVGDRVRLAAIVGMTQLNGWTARVMTVPLATTFTIDVNTTGFTAYGSGGTTAKLLTGDYPDCALFYRGRLYYACTAAKITTIWASESGNYDIYTIPALNTATSALQFTIADITQRIEWMFGGDNSLIVGTAEAIVAVNGGSVGDTITAGTIEATITSAEGANHAYPLRKDGLIFYLGQDGRNTYYFKYDLLTESFVSNDANLLSYDITLGGLTKLRYKKDRNDLVCFTRGDEDLVTLNFKERENITGWHEHMSQGAVKDIAVITDNNGKPQLFALMKYGSTFYIERQAEGIEFAQRVNFFTGKTAEAKAADQEAYNRYVAEQLRECIYLDNAVTYSDLRTATITYNSGAGTITAGDASFVVGDVGKHIVYKTLTGYESGRFLITGYTSSTVVSVSVLQVPTANVYSSWYLSFSSLSGLGQFNGTTVGIVADGGYIEDREISGGTTSFDAEITSVVIGYRYKGHIKSFSLGFQVQGANTQTTLKAINRIGIRTTASAGGEIGSTPYHTQPVQELKGDELNYLPPLPIDGTQYVTYTDDTEEDKYFHVIQDVPLPFHVCAAMVEAQYATSS